jgi:hypothetical protein
MLLMMHRVVAARTPQVAHSLIAGRGGSSRRSFCEAGYTSGQCSQEQGLGKRDDKDAF